MLFIPSKGDLLVQHNFPTVSSFTPGTSITSGATSSTKGATTQLIASTNFDSYWLTVYASELAASAGATEGCLDIMIGSATESTLIANLLCGYAGGGDAADPAGKVWHFPIYIASGQRISARFASAATSSTMRVGVWLYGGQGYPHYPCGSKVVTYGVSSVPNGTSITPGASLAEGSWTQITSSTSEDLIALVPSFQLQGDTSLTISQYAVDVGIGAATEEEIGQSYWYRTSNLEKMEGPYPNAMPIFKNIPNGSRLVMRASNNNVNDAGYGAALHGVC